MILLSLISKVLVAQRDSSTLSEVEGANLIWAAVNFGASQE